jgi:biopolymer transport protein ExbD
MKLRSRVRRKEARIEIVPLIDIMFFLLATFVMVSTAMIKNKGIAVQLPSSETSETSERKDYASLSITENGDFFLDKTQVTPEELDFKLREFKGSTADPKVFVNGDKNAQIAKLVAALDAVRKVGITKIGIETGSPK